MRAGSAGIRSCRSGAAALFWLFLLSFLLPPVKLACAEDNLAELMAESHRIEMQAMELLSEHFDLEHNLLFPENEKVVFFLSLPQGASVVLQSVKMSLNGRQVVDHRYRAIELESFLSGGVQPLYMAKLPPGNYKIDVELRAMVGRLKPFGSYEFVKKNGVKFIEIVAAGLEQRELEFHEW